ncbi:glycoside hydrolase family 95 protein [Saccharopolyspora sp. K220]|uniref:glycoside hydrolase family 95 protein n=1 Tax=Saccharopolyspora soli TaxID=2926618 RepID=UPI001F568E74|nr:glycoside hydrolase family 95 protein [Saccharopolyspora soli]MCI2422222.1 glycoside hydrolase family 95 protein [Saccharopolyspora soli]
MSSVLGVGALASGLPTFTAQAAPQRPAVSSLVATEEATRLWYPAPAAEGVIIEQGLPVGNGRLGALVGGDPARDFLYLTDVTLWTGGLNDTLDADGQFPYDPANFGTFSLLAKLFVLLPDHIGVSDYRRELDLSNGIVTTTYTHDGATHRREVYASHPDDVVIVRLSGGELTGSVVLEGTHGESTVGEVSRTAARFSGSFPNGLAYGAAVTASAIGGAVEVRGTEVAFVGCREVVIVFSGGTNYVPDSSTGFKDPTLDPVAVALARVAAAARIPGAALLNTHVADYRERYDRMTIDLGESTAQQRGMDTWSRLVARGGDGAAPDPELEASYLQFGRYLMITGSRRSLPINLQGLWLSNNTPDWYSDYHTDINLQMNYWLADRAALSDCFDAFADYCVAQLPEWSKQTRALFNDPRNRFRNTSGKVAGWTTAFSSNIYGGLGWWWHPAGNAWLCNSLWEHYDFTQDTGYLSKIYPLLKGACEFWESRLIESPQGLIDDHDWSPEHGPQDARGITYAQELVWDLFGKYRIATDVLHRDQDYGRAMSALRDRLYLPEVSPTTGMLQEWMSPDDLGETTHRHLSGLIGFFPGDRIRADGGHPDLVEGVRQTLIRRGVDSFGWACAWRSACWARLRDADRAYQLLLNVLRPSIDFANGTAPNMFDMYSFGDRAIFQIDANLGAPTAMLEMVLYSRPGVIELLPALPGAWARSGSVAGIGARGGFVVDLSWRDGAVTEATIHSVGGRTTEVRAGAWTRTLRLREGESITVTPTS